MWIPRALFVVLAIAIITGSILGLMTGHLPPLNSSPHENLQGHADLTPGGATNEPAHIISNLYLHGCDIWNGGNTIACRTASDATCKTLGYTGGYGMIGTQAGLGITTDYGSSTDIVCLDATIATYHEYPFDALAACDATNPESIACNRLTNAKCQADGATSSVGVVTATTNTVGTYCISADTTTFSVTLPDLAQYNHAPVPGIQNDMPDCTQAAVQSNYACTYHANKYCRAQPGGFSASTPILDSSEDAHGNIATVTITCLKDTPGRQKQSRVTINTQNNPYAGNLIHPFQLGLNVIGSPTIVTNGPISVTDGLENDFAYPIIITRIASSTNYVGPTYSRDDCVVLVVNTPGWTPQEVCTYSDEHDSPVVDFRDTGILVPPGGQVWFQATNQWGDPNHGIGGYAWATITATPVNPGVPSLQTLGVRSPRQDSGYTINDANRVPNGPPLVINGVSFPYYVSIPAGCNNAADCTAPSTMLGETSMRTTNPWYDITTPTTVKGIAFFLSNGISPGKQGFNPCLIIKDHAGTTTLHQCFPIISDLMGPDTLADNALPGAQPGSTYLPLNIDIPAGSQLGVSYDILSETPTGMDLATYIWFADQAPTDPCASVTCNAPPGPYCFDTSTLRTYDATGTCSLGQCQYAVHDTTCLNGCANNVCADPCAGVTCNAPPASSCIDATTLRAYDATGTCSLGQCAYTHTDTSCPGGCANNACTAPCAGVSCNSPPGPYCFDTSTLRTYGTTGTCSLGQCAYTHTDTSCPGGCANNACTDACAGVTCSTPPAPSCLNATSRRTYDTGTCNNGTCHYQNTTHSCDPALTPFCASGQCIACRADQDCSSGHHCTQQQCVPTGETVWYQDADNDTYGNPAVSTLSASQPAGYVTTSQDCNDNNPSVHPAATEVCNGIDDNCDGTVDNGASCTGGRSCNTGTCTCTGNQAWNGSLCANTTSACGNGIIENGEACDEGHNNGPCPQACSANCTLNVCTPTTNTGSRRTAPPPPSPTVTHTWRNIPTHHTVTFTIARDTIAITALSFTTRQPLAQLTMSVTPTNATPPPGVTAYQAFTVDAGLADTIGTNFTLSFTINKPWLRTNNITPDTIRLYREENSTWKEYDVVHTREDTTLVRYTANVPGFSRFLIGTTTPRAQELTAPQPTTPEPSTNTPSPPAIDQPTTSLPLTDTPARTTTPALIVPYVLLGLTVLIAGLTTYLHHRRNTNPDDHPALLETFIHHHVTAGHTPHDIETALLNNGWPPHLVAKAFLTLHLDPSDTNTTGTATTTTHDPLAPLQHYIEHSLNSGIPPETIRDRLLAAGWHADTIGPHLANTRRNKRP